MKLLKHNGRCRLDLCSFDIYAARLQTPQRANTGRKFADFTFNLSDGEFVDEWCNEGHAERLPQRVAGSWRHQEMVSEQLLV